MQVGNVKVSRCPVLVAHPFFFAAPFGLFVGFLDLLAAYRLVHLFSVTGYFAFQCFREFLQIAHRWLIPFG